MYASVEKPIIIEIIRLNSLHWFGHDREWKKIEFPKRCSI